MARRTRRNLSDPTVKRIVRQRSRQTSPKIKANREKINNNSRNRIVFFTILVFLIFCIIVILNSFSILRLDFFTQSEADSTKIQTQQEIRKPISTTTNKVEESTSSATEQESEVSEVIQKIQVEVLNGCGVAGVASRLTDYLRDQDIDVVSTGNYKSFNVSTSFIFNRSGKTENSQQIAELLGLDVQNIRESIDTSLQMDATVVIGKDYKNIKPFLN